MLGCCQSAPAVDGKTMKAVLREDGMKFTLNHAAPPMPKADSNEVLIRIKAAGINPIDYKGPKSVLGPIVGLDVAGVVEAVAEGAAGKKHGLKVGDEVYGLCKGSLAELGITTANQLAKKSKNISFVQAAALPTSYLTGLQALRDHGGLKKGGKAMVIGASGGCGLAAIQLGRCLEAGQVVGVCSAKNKEIVEKAGAHRVVDYNTENIAELYGGLPEGEKFDVVFDAASGSGGGEDYEDQSWKVLKAEGQYVPINGSPLSWIRFFMKIQASRKHLFLAKVNTLDMDEMSKYIEAKKLEITVAKVCPFTEAGVKEAFDMLKGRRTVGKISINMDAN